ncbi:MAG: hypothetical protein KDI68_07225 [Gammaproteobacteria bacterium]|nr:hypothetical protein [Gammaproteobacteria bacterium]
MNEQRDCTLYSIRQVNPFTGVIQVIHTSEGQASSDNGVDWQIEILTSGAIDTWSMASGAGGEKRSIKFGRWNASAGLHGIPANPILDLTRMLAHSRHLAGLLQEHAQRIPFPQRDNWELWLLDDERLQPLALLATSTREHPATPTQCKVRWRAADGALLGPMALRALERAVANRAATGHCRWLKRTPEMETTTVQESHSHAPSLPPLLLAEAWPDASTGQLVAEYHDALAPQLLALQHLSDATRSMLELSAVKRSQSLEAVWRLYPRIINRHEFDAARVEARLRSG